MFTHRIASDPIDINAPAEHVWQILTVAESYRDWNPFTPHVDTDFRPGSRVELRVILGPLKLRQQERIQSLEPPRLLAWGMTMGHRVLLVARREQRLEASGPDRCRYVTTDTMSGLLTPLVALLFGRLIRIGFNAMAAALKERAEISERRPSSGPGPGPP